MIRRHPTFCLQVSEKEKFNLHEKCLTSTTT